MYSRIESRFWQDEKMRNVSAEARYLMLYLLTSPHRNVLGFYFLPEPYACFDLGWTQEQFRERLGELLRNGLVKYDETVHVVLITNFLKHNPLENHNQVKSAIQKLDEIPKTPLFKNFYEAVQKYATGKKHYLPLLERLEELLREQLPQQLPEQLGEGLGKPVTVTVTETETVTDIYSKQPQEINNGGGCEISSLPEVLQDEDLKRLATAYRENGFGLLPPAQVDTVLELAKKYSVEWVILAFQQASIQGHRNLAYVRGILKRWKENGQPDLGENTSKGKKRDSPKYKRFDFSV